MSITGWDSEGVGGKFPYHFFRVKDPYLSLTLRVRSLNPLGTKKETISCSNDL